MAEVRVLDVLLHGAPVGTLTHVPGDRTLFAFAEDYAADERRPVLGLSFKDRFGELITSFRPTRTRLRLPDLVTMFVAGGVLGTF